MALLGPLSDRTGRRPVLLLVILASCAPAVTYLTTNDIQVWAVVDTIRGVVASEPSGIFAFLYMCAADVSCFPQPHALRMQLMRVWQVTGPRTRSFGVSVISGGAAVGVVAGGLFGKFISEPPWDCDAGEEGKRKRIFGAQIVFTAISLLIAAFTVSEARVSVTDPRSPGGERPDPSVPSLVGRAKRACSRWRANIAVACVDPLRRCILCMLLLASFGLDSYHEVGAMYARNQFGWASGTSMLWVACSGCGGILACWVVMPLLARWSSNCGSMTVGASIAVLASVAALFGGSQFFYASGAAMNFLLMVKAAGVAELSVMVTYAIDS